MRRMDIGEQTNLGHWRILRLAGALGEARSLRRRADLLRHLAQALERHFEGEEVILYSACQRVVLTLRDRELFHQAETHHRGILGRMATLRSTDPSGEAFQSAAAELTRALNSLFHWEESLLVPLARRAFGRAELSGLAERLAQHGAGPPTWPALDGSPRAVGTVLEPPPKARRERP